MAAIDYKTALINLLWATLEANGSAFSALVKPGSRLKLTAAGQAANRAQRAPADYPQVKIEHGVGRKEDTPHITFANTISQSAVVPVRHQLVITVTYSSEEQSKQTPVESAIDAGIYAMYAAGSLPYIMGMTTSESRTKQQDKTIVRILANYSMRLRFSELTG